MDGLHSLFLLFVWCLLARSHRHSWNVPTFWLWSGADGFGWSNKVQHESEPNQLKLQRCCNLAPPFQPSLPDHYVLENHLKLLWPPLLSLQDNLEHTFTAAPFIYTSDSISVILVPAQLSIRGGTVTPSSLPEAAVTSNPVKQWEATVSCLRTHVRLLEDVIVLPQFEVRLQWPKLSFSFFRNALFF